ncbi:MAG: ATP-dependent Clp protease proteolytic subunit [Puniceicoccales bacterium]|jgi:ATP-dependent Clp protease protease subunit|nr:ATP-dependent Clp protease proteolytic subunit [Puniceicoccales bacterium]
MGNGRDDEDDGEEEEEVECCGKRKRYSALLRVQEKFLETRKVFLWGSVDDDSAKAVVEKLLFLDLEKPGDPITFYINTPGGGVTAGMAIYDTIRLLSSPVTVVVMGMAASMGSILLCAAEKGRRLLYPGARVLIHQPLIQGQIYAPAVDLNIQAVEMERTREEMNVILSRASGQPIEKIRQDTDRDFFLNAQEAIKYGLADAIVQPPAERPPDR